MLVDNITAQNQLSLQRSKFRDVPEKFRWQLRSEVVRKFCWGLLPAGKKAVTKFPWTV